MNIEHFVRQYQAKIDEGMSLKDAVESFQRKLLVQAFKESATFSQVTAKLNIKHPNVHQMIKRLRISKRCLRYRDENRDKCFER